MSNLLDLMKPEDKEKVLKRFEKRKEDKGIQNKISNEMFLLSEFGYYYGWEAVKDVRSNKITFEEMFALLEGARKVWYQKLTEQYRMTTTSIGTSFAKRADAKRVFDSGMGEIVKKGKI